MICGIIKDLLFYILIQKYLIQSILSTINHCLGAKRINKAGGETYVDYVVT